MLKESRPGQREKFARDRYRIIFSGSPGKIPARVMIENRSGKKEIDVDFWTGSHCSSGTIDPHFSVSKSENDSCKKMRSQV
jgi:hypothetical protein